MWMNFKKFSHAAAIIPFKLTELMQSHALRGERILTRAVVESVVVVF